MKNIFAIMIGASLIGGTSFAQTPVTLPSVINPAQNVTTTTVPNGSGVNTSGTGVQSTGRESSGKNTGYMVVAGAMGVFFGYKAVGACSSQNWPMCALYTSGAVLSGVAVMNINKQKKSNNNMADAVTSDGNNPNLPDDPSNPNNPNNPSITPGGTPGDGAPIANRINSNLRTVRNLGVRTNPDGSVTTPDGQTRNFGDMSAGALSRAGLSDKDIKSFMAAVDAAKKDADEKAKTTDANSELFGETPSGGGGRGTITTAMPGGGPAGGPRGLDRNPAQVAGMSVNYGGEQIGVGADNIYMMIHRRYDFHENQGGFLNPPAPAPAPSGP